MTERIHATIVELLSDFTIATMLDCCMDMEKWTRRVFKIFKKLKQVDRESQVAVKLMRLVVVLFSKKKGLSKHEIREKLEINLSEKS